MSRAPMTREGFAALTELLRRLKGVERPRIVKAIAEAREHGDLSENAEYHAAREQQGMNEARITRIESALATAQVVDIASLSGDAVKFGATVSLEDQDSGASVVYAIVGEEEADVARGRISIASPLARALIGRKEGDLVEAATPRGRLSYEIIEVTFRALEFDPQDFS